ncbi:unnamed protein product [Paramecium pentaurelia]|uniref:Uncharacterized protein n=1 Tax=Paramecium pentaurelia TaxID=43138 RepID=A0A8S1UUT2_9CILI|nr:unnamed protein product [Paramecium pentaurelia]
MIIQLVILQVVKAQIQEWDNYYNSFVNNNMSELESWFIAGARTQNYITVCSEQQILGGYYIFGMGTAVQQLFYLPPHYQIRISGGCWENEILNIILVVRKVPVNVDTVIKIFNLQLKLQFHINRKPQLFFLRLIQIIGRMNFGDLITSISIYQNVLLIAFFAMRIHLIYVNQKWISQLIGFLKQMLMDGYQEILCLLNQLFYLDKISLIGGNQILGKSDLLINKIKLDLHYLIKIQAKIWLIDIQGLTNSVNISIDGIPYKLNINSVSSISFFASSPQESIQNIDWNFTHQNPEIEIQFIPTSLVGSNSFWALFNFNLFIFKCHSYCIKCLGLLKLTVRFVLKNGQKKMENVIEFKTSQNYQSINPIHSQLINIYSLFIQTLIN